MPWLLDAAADPSRRRSDLPDPPPRPWPRLWVPGILLGIGMSVSLLVLPSTSQAADFLALICGLTGLVLLLGAALTMSGWARTVWWSLFAFQALTMVSVAAASVQADESGSIAFPSTADAVALLAYLPALVALGTLIRRLYPGHDREAWIDASILTVTAASVMGLFVIAPILSSPVLGGLPTAVALAYPILDLVLLSALVWLLVGTHRPTPTLVLVALGMAATLAADVTRDLLLIQSPTDVPIGDLTALRLVALTITAAAAWTPTAESFVAGPSTARRRTGTPRLAILTAGVLTVPAIVAIRVWQEGVQATLLLVLAAIVIIILAVWRIQILVTAVERQRRVTELVLDSAGDGIIGLDREGFVLFANLSARRMLRCRESDLVGHRFHDIAHHEHPDGSPYRWQECPIHASVTSDHDAYLSDQRYIRRDGTAFPVEIVMSPLIIEGEVVGAVQSFRDVSERQEMEEIKRQFVSVVSHELRTPLTSIKGSLQMLDSGLLGPLTGEQQELVSMAVANSDRLGKLVNDILDLERLDAGRMPLHPVRVSARDLADQAVTGIAGAADAAGVRLERDLTDDDTTVDVDPDRLIQVLTNLLGNAIKFSERGAIVTMVVHRRTDADTDTVMLQVRDRGRGIPSEQLETVFERFGQVEVGDARREGGTGLGLAIAQEIVHRSGGTITVESAVGVGSTFTVTLPRASGDASASAAAPVEEVSS